MEGLHVNESRAARMELDAALCFDIPMTPDDRLLRALEIVGLATWQIRRARSEGASDRHRHDDLIRAAVEQLEGLRQ